MIYAFGDGELDVRRYKLRRGGTVRKVEPQVLDVLALLIRDRTDWLHEEIHGHSLGGAAS